MRRGAQEATKVRRRGDGAQASPGTTPTGARSRTRYLAAGVAEGGQRRGTWRRQAQGTAEMLAAVEQTEAGGAGGNGLRQDLSRKKLADSGLSPFKRSHARPPQGRAFGN